jgi:hypothetical protein
MGLLPHVTLVEFDISLGIISDGRLLDDYSHDNSVYPLYPRYYLYRVQMSHTGLLLGPKKR